MRLLVKDSSRDSIPIISKVDLMPNNCLLSISVVLISLGVLVGGVLENSRQHSESVGSGPYCSSIQLPELWGHTLIYRPELVI